MGLATADERDSGTSLLAQPGFKGGNERRALLLAHAQTFLRAQAIDAALDVEQRVDAPDRLQRDRRDRRRVLAAPGVGRDVGQLEELPPRMGPTQRRRDRPLRARRIVEPVVAAIGVRLQDAGEAGQVPVGMLVPPVTRGVVERRRRRRAAEWPVVPHIGPDMPGDRLALGQDRHRGVVAMQPLGRQHMRLDQGVQRRQGGRAGAHLVGERRHAQIDAFAPVALALPVQRLVLGELLEQDHGQQVRPRKAARRHMERRRRLADRLAGPAGELLPHGLDHRKRRPQATCLSAGTAA